METTYYNLDAKRLTVYDMASGESVPRPRSYTCIRRRSSQPRPDEGKDGHEEEGADESRRGGKVPLQSAHELAGGPAQGAEAAAPLCAGDGLLRHGGRGGHGRGGD